MLVDSSVWVDYFRGGPSPEADYLDAAIAADADLCLCGVVLTEVLQGIGPPRVYRKVRGQLDALLYLPTPREAYALAADIYRAARAQGRTIRNTVDCIIAACAIVHDVPLLQRDRDFVTIASVSKLQLTGV